MQICADTVVGDAMLRGVSGGQKKRVTTAEMLVGPKKILFLDEISTGLVPTGSCPLSTLPVRCSRTHLLVLRQHLLAQKQEVPPRRKKLAMDPLSVDTTAWASD